MKRKLSVRCKCGSWGTIFFKEEVAEDGREIVTFKCICGTPIIDFDRPFHGYYA